MSKGEDELELQLLSQPLRAPTAFVRELVFAKPRRWRFDFAWPEQMLAVEVEGGTWSGGRHTRGAGFVKDTEKYAVALINGWRVLRVTTGQVSSGQALDWIKQLLYSSLDP